MIALRHDTCFQYEKTVGLRPIIDTFLVLYFCIIIVFFLSLNKVKLIIRLDWFFFRSAAASSFKIFQAELSSLRLKVFDRFLSPRLCFLYLLTFGILEIEVFGVKLNGPFSQQIIRKCAYNGQDRRSQYFYHSVCLQSSSFPFNFIFVISS